MSLEDIERATRLTEDQETFTRENINSFILAKLGEAASIKASCVEINNFEELIKLIIGQAFSSYEEMSYTIEFINEIVSIYGYTTRNFIIYRK